MHNLDARVVGANVVAPPVVLHQLERQDHVVQETVEQVRRDSTDADQNGNAVDDPRIEGVHEVV